MATVVYSTDDKLKPFRKFVNKKILFTPARRAIAALVNSSYELNSRACFILTLQIFPYAK